MKENKKQICLINDSFPPVIDGVANAVLNYASWIEKKYGDATVVTPFYPDTNDDQYDFDVVRYPSIDTSKLLGYRAGLPFDRETVAVLEEKHFDLIHAHCPMTAAMLARLLKQQEDIPLVLTYHTKYDIDIANAIRSEILQEEAIRLLVENINAFDEVWTVSSGARDNLRKIGYSGACTVMPNGVDLPKGAVDDEIVKKLKSEHDIPEDVPVYLFIGRMMWYKGIRIILDALSELTHPFCMVFVGDGNDKEEIVKYTEEKGLNDRVIFVDAVRDRQAIRSWYSLGDLFLFPSTFDTNGLVVREAAACGLPAVLVEGSCAAEGVEHGVNGYLIEENSQSLAKLLSELNESHEGVRSCGEKAMDTLYLSWEDAVHNACLMYDEVITRYKAGEYPKKKQLDNILYKNMAKLFGTFNTYEEKLWSGIDTAFDYLEEMDAAIDRILR